MGFYLGVILIIIKFDHCPPFINVNTVKFLTVKAITHRFTQIIWHANVKLPALE